MKKKFRALITDVDGTLIPNRKDGQVSPKVQAAIKKAKKKIHVGLATSRDVEDIRHITSALELSGPSVLYSGSWVVDASSFSVLWEKTIEKDVFEKALNIANGVGFYFVINDNGRKYKPGESYSPINPINIWGHGLTPEEFKEFKKQISQLSQVTLHSVPSWKEGKIDFVLNHPLATKQHAIFEMAKLLNISPDEIIGIGDGGNDLPLLMACGLKVAVGNAVDDLKAVADYVAPSVEEDALADIIEKFIL